MLSTITTQQYPQSSRSSNVNTLDKQTSNTTSKTVPQLDQKQSLPQINAHKSSIEAKQPITEEQIKNMFQINTEQVVPVGLTRANSTGCLVKVKTSAQASDNQALKRSKSESDISVSEIIDEVVNSVDSAAELGKTIASWAAVGGAIGTLILPGIGTGVGTAIGAISRLAIEGLKRIWNFWSQHSDQQPKQRSIKINDQPAAKSTKVKYC